MSLPEPTTDQASQIADLDEFGYCIIADALSPDDASALRERISTQAQVERIQDLDFHYPAEAEGDDVNQWVYQLINKGDEFQQLALHPETRALATYLLGDSRRCAAAAGLEPVAQMALSYDFPPLIRAQFCLAGSPTAFTHAQRPSVGARVHAAVRAGCPGSA